MGNYFFLLLILVCPLMMVFMMRGHRGHRGHGGRADRGQAQGHTGGHGHDDPSASIDELRHQREQLDSEIEERVAEKQTLVGADER
jgi:Spy/CpxP family protein refolding chaperone